MFPLDHFFVVAFIGNFSNIVPTLLKLLSVEEILGFISVLKLSSLSQELLRPSGHIVFLLSLC